MTGFQLISVVVSLVIVALVGVACEQLGDPSVDGGIRPGDPEVYQRIESMEDCDALKSEYLDWIEAAARIQQGEDDPRRLQRVWRDYADAADARMSELDCENDPTRTNEGSS